MSRRRRYREADRWGWIALVAMCVTGPATGFVLLGLIVVLIVLLSAYSALRWEDSGTC